MDKQKTNQLGQTNSKTIKILVINGPNINMLGIREKNLYGAQTYEQLLEFIREVCENEPRRVHTQASDTTNAIAKIDVEFFQSNSEGAIVDCIQNAYDRVDGIILNPAAYTHTSIAIPDALKAVAIPTVEVHLTDINSREEYRRISYVSPCVNKTICGKGFEGYREAVEYLYDLCLSS